MVINNDFGRFSFVLSLSGTKSGHARPYIITHVLHLTLFSRISAKFYWPKERLTDYGD